MILIRILTHLKYCKTFIMETFQQQHFAAMHHTERIRNLSYFIAPNILRIPSNHSDGD